MSQFNSANETLEFRHPPVVSVEDLMRLDGRSIAVTGGASGIGLAAVEAIVALGGRATIIDLSPETVDREVASLQQAGHDVDGYAADVTDGDAIRRALEASTARTGFLDGLVASAGIRMKSEPVTDLELSTWQQIIDVNLTGTFLTCKAAAGIMAGQGRGSIVTVASTSAHAARFKQAAYCVSKAGVVQFSRVLALELAASGVRVNSVCPGTTITAMFNKALEQDGEQIVRDRIEGTLSGFRGGVPLRRLSDAIDQAAAIIFLLTDASRHITGQSMLVDGGESLV